jgi:DNA polymerase-1
VETIFQRRRYIPELKERNFNIRAFGERVAANAPIQGSAADLIKIAMINVDRAILKEGMQSRMLLQVHDELVFELPPEEETALATLVKREMEGAATLDVPLRVRTGWRSKAKALLVRFSNSCTLHGIGATPDAAPCRIDCNILVNDGVITA